jgi:hypothetical protein
MNHLFFGFFVFSGVLSLGAQTASWQPSPGHTQLPIWPGTVPDAHPVPGPEVATTINNKLVAGRPWVEVDNVSRPTMTVYSPEGKNTGTAVVVFPGGGYVRLAIDLEGTEVCDWLTSEGITCVLLKYRVRRACLMTGNASADPADLPYRHSRWRMRRERWGWCAFMPTSDISILTRLECWGFLQAAI